MRSMSVHWQHRNQLENCSLLGSAHRDRVAQRFHCECALNRSMASDTCLQNIPCQLEARGCAKLIVLSVSASAASVWYAEARPEELSPGN